MLRPELTATLLRFWIGAAGSLAAGWLVFRSAVFRPDHAAFQCITIGALTAGILALQRAGRPLHALALAVGFALFQLGLVEAEGWVVASSGVVMGLGIFVVALIFDLLAREGVLFGKFLILGPLLGGVYLAATPLAQFHGLTGTGAVRTLMQFVLIGVVIGDGAGLGVELVDLVVRAAERAGPRSARKPSPTGAGGAGREEESGT